MNPLDENAPDYSRGFLRLPHSVWQDLYCRAPLTRRQLQLVSLVLRESWGWQKRGGAVHLWTRPLPIRHFAQATRLSTDHLARDLKALVARGVLREEAGRYQFVPDPRLWKTPLPAPPKPRPRALKSPRRTAKTAPPAPGLKTAKISQRNVPPLSGDELSPAGDNARVAGRPPLDQQTFQDPSVSEEHFVAVVAAFVGELSRQEAADLGTWVQQEGVSVVWAALAEAFGCGPRAMREALRRRLGQQQGTGA